MTAPTRTARPSTHGEHLANALSHGFGMLLAVSALPVLVIDALRA
jgi:predicted membrane channel-forming protein YqfA (hemolysin III family)